MSGESESDSVSSANSKGKRKAKLTTDEKKERDRERARRYREKKKQTMEKGQKKSLKDMTPDELKEHNRARKAEYRARKATQAVDSDMDMSQMSVKSVSQLDFSRLNLDASSAPSTQMEVDGDVVDSFVAPASTLPKKKKIKDMSPEELREYRRQKQKEHRAKASNSAITSQSLASVLGSGSEVSMCSDIDTDTPMSSKEPPKSSQRKRHQPGALRNAKKVKPAPLPERHHNVKVRFAWISLFLVETVSIVIPHYLGAPDTPHSIKNQFIKKLPTREDREEFERDLASQEWVDKMGNFRPVVQNTALWPDIIHVAAPFCRPKQFTVASEAALRATYISILHFCDASGFLSVGLPLLGKGVSRRKSLAIALQSFHAYFQAVPSTKLELVYLVTRKEKEYDMCGEFTGFIREIDLSVWSREMVDKLIDGMFGKLKTHSWYATMPGTDMVCRVLKGRHTDRKKREEQAAVAKIHESMCQLTGINSSACLHFQNSSSDIQKLPMEEIQMYDTGYSFIDLKVHGGFNTVPPIQQQCGSYVVKRKLWILSYYYMFYGGASEDELAGQSVFDVLFRKKLFYKLKPLHRGVVKEWIRIRKLAPYPCECPMINGFHENFTVFNTELSHYDSVYVEWIAKDMTLVFPADDTHLFTSPINWTPRIVMETEPAAVIVPGKSFQWTPEHIDKVEEWRNVRVRFLVNHSRNARSVFNALNLNTFATGNEQRQVDDEPHDLLENHQTFLESPQCTDAALNTTKLNVASKRREIRKARENNLPPEHIERLTEEMRAELRSLHLKLWVFHVEYVQQVEQVMRNRTYKRKSLQLDGGDAIDLWKHHNSFPQTADGYKIAYMEEHQQEFAIDSDSDSEDELVVNFEEPVDLGNREFECKYCGALQFECDNGHSCCKSGQVWIDPLPKLPPAITRLFQKKYKNHLIATNAAFAMASIRYTRVPQAAHGVQSWKIKGLISFHPSALHPRNPDNPLFANFIILNHDNPEIAQKRFATLRTEGPSGLREIFDEIQSYMDENNCMMDVYKNMYTLEQEAERDGIDQSRIKFRIVSPHEVDEQFFKDVQSHPGVYAKKSQIGTGYISVAYSFDPNSEFILPRGMTVYPKNPRDHPQKPLSVFSENSDILAFPTLHPDGRGGWQPHKYDRWTRPKVEIPLFEARKQDHIRRIRANGEDPKKYWNNVSSQEDGEEPVDPAEDVEMEEAVPGADEYEEDQQTDLDLSDNEEVILMDREDMPIEDILQLGAHEDLQEAPLNSSIGQRPNIRMQERGGDMYAVLDLTEKMVDIPLRDDQALADSDSEVDDPLLYEDRCQEPSELVYLDNPADATKEGVNEMSDSEEEDPLLQRDRYQDPSEQYYDNYQYDQYAVADDIEMAQGEHEAVQLREDDQDEADFDHEIVFHGDEDTAEYGALGRRNDGIQNIGKRQFVSLAEYANFQMKPRRDIPNRYQGGGQSLCQLKVIDWAIINQELKAKVITEKRAEYARGASRTDVFKFYEKMVQDKVPGKKSLGMLVTMPSTVPGTGKYQRELVMSAITVSNQLGHPDMFVTFTGNPTWPEIQRECRRLNVEWPDIPEHVNTVFWHRAKIFLDDLCGRKVKSSAHHGKYIRQPGKYGKIRWFNFSVEFQQRGMPHIHLLLSLENHITTSEQVDSVVSAEVPPIPDKNDIDYKDKWIYRNAVQKFMTHFPCKGDEQAYCNIGKKPNWKRCKKDFPKLLSPKTILSDNAYPTLKRTETNKFYVQRGDKIVIADSTFIVAHSPEMIVRHTCHINIEITSTIRLVQYMFKYIHKGSDRVLLEATESFGNRKGQLTGAEDSMTLMGNVIAPANIHSAVLQQRQNLASKMMRAAGVSDADPLCLNDCHYNMDLGAMTACEAAWRLMGLPMHGSSHIVHRGYVHEENNELVFFKRGLSSQDAANSLQAKPRTMLQAWFDVNKDPVQLPDGRTTTDLTFDEVFKFYKYELKTHKFVLRKKDMSRHILGRIQAPQPRFLELTATRLLAQHVQGPTSFTELRTFDGVVYETCLEAARARRLMTGQSEWDDVLKEVGRYRIPAECRRVFASILLFCGPCNPKDLFLDNVEVLVNAKKSWSQEQRVAHALRHIQFLLNAHGTKLANYELGDTFNIDHLPQHFEGDEDADNPDAVRFDKTEHKQKGSDMYENLNKDQKVFVDRALWLASTASTIPKVVFLDGPGGTGKTYCYETIYHLLQSRGLQVLCVAHTGIAACLLPSGCTAHRKFSIPLTASDNMFCRVTKGTPDADRLKNTSAIIWDEAVMTDRRVMDSVDRLFRDLKDEPDVPFGGVLLIMGGDWRQILPIVEGITGPGVVNYTLKRGPLWDHVEQFKLTANQRASGDPEYAEYILKVGDGANYIHAKKQQIAVPEKLVLRGDEKDLIRWVFPNIDDIEATKSAAILTTDNRTALRINDEIIDNMDGEVKEYLSVDECDTSTGLAVDPEVFAKVCPQGLPPHLLKLKVGAQVVLLRNINVTEGLCNGTRLTIENMGRSILTCKMNTSGKICFLQRQLMTPSGKNGGFRRTQYPIRLAYCSTINKAQGQTLSRVGLLLNSDAFAHGQVYVAMSRVKHSEGFRVCHFKRRNADDHFYAGGILMRNVVLPEALQ